MEFDNYQSIINRLEDSVSEIKNGADSIFKDLKFVKRELVKIKKDIAQAENKDLINEFESQTDRLFADLKYKSDDFSKMSYNIKEVRNTFDKLEKKIKYFN
jgi:chromosome segregation ATPase